MGHVLEGAVGNIAGQLRQPPGGHMFAGQADTQPAYPAFAQSAAQPDPWMQPGGDPWGGSAGAMRVALEPPPQWNAPAFPSIPVQQPPQPAYPSVPGNDYASDSDTDTISSLGEGPDYQSPELANLSPTQVDAQLFWAYTKAKSAWRGHMRRPTRKVRKFVKRTKGKGQLGEGRRRYHSWMR